MGEGEEGERGNERLGVSLKVTSGQEEGEEKSYTTHPPTVKGCHRVDMWLRERRTHKPSFLPKVNLVIFSAGLCVKPANYCNLQYLIPGKCRSIASELPAVTNEGRPCLVA